jgi:hypothetical protein
MRGGLGATVSWHRCQQEAFGDCVQKDPKPLHGFLIPGRRSQISGERPYSFIARLPSISIFTATAWSFVCSASVK